MRQGTTPKHTFTLPFYATACQKIRVIYAQGGIVKIVKTSKDIDVYGNDIVVNLSQADTLRLNCKLKNRNPGPRVDKQWQLACK
jgi:hypothetical protein